MLLLNTKKKAKIALGHFFGPKELKEGPRSRSKELQEGPPSGSYLLVSVKVQVKTFYLTIQCLGVLPVRPASNLPAPWQEGGGAEGQGLQQGGGRSLLPGSAGGLSGPDQLPVMGLPGGGAGGVSQARTAQGFKLPKVEVLKLKMSLIYFEVTPT